MYQPATIGDFVWEDTNKNGKQDIGESGISGLTVELYNCSTDELESSTTTNASGYYNFSVTPGNYYVQFSSDGYEFTSANQGTDDSMDSDADSSGNTTCITVESGETNDTVDAGLYQPATIGDFVWEDTNKNGKQDIGETGISGLTVELYNCSTDELESSTTTNASGYYNFSVTPGSYYVNFSSDGYEFTLANQGTDDGVDSDADSSGNTTCITVESGKTNDTIDAGLYQPENPKASMGDFVWEDLDGDGTQDIGEPGIFNVTVYLYDCVTGNLIATTNTDEDGEYLFTGLTPGVYNVSFAAPPESGYVFTPKDQGSDEKDSDANSTGNTTCINLVSGETNDTIDAGMYQPASVSDFVWNDTNCNGIQDPGEKGVANVEVRLYNIDGDYITSEITNASGFYKFLVPPGHYYLNFVLPEGHEFSPQFMGGDINKDSDVDNTGNTSIIMLTSGENNVTIDAGIFKASPSIQIEKFTNGKDADEPRGPVVQVGTQVTWTYNVTNTGNVNLTNINVTDSKGVEVNCLNTTLEPDESMVCNAIGTAKLGQYSNYGNVTAEYNGVQVNDSDPSHYFGHDHWTKVPTANPVLLIGVLGVAMLLLLRREQK
ncbi:conserved repeat domain protein (plasmid) [Methanohalobium evestigatum Z-7303]|uniref:Conserved repeat domain protein n=1 Tax=Methanohalobium evestigatum (strain ATCC BAA-1072 / DSM 3721 / NBRC 107634 / OCM 161 / Z-7303) TaxID=644295 RepID=D7EBW2_METEZ|nr:SdrD B-like domain-containing protein [Methanohalobium evestigatum]ADI75084.1 conserved repeat domain protein [Methanohalobium evestigatum Z-7303]